jgi:GDP/UDP-N,N'-diacetylbacillosamine 2-epimerase (hydrolysing)
MKICIATGSRAEYGLMFPLLTLLRQEPNIELQLLVTGMHLSPEFGLTQNQMLKDGFEIHESVEMLLSSDTEVGTVKGLGLGMIGYADALKRLQPDWVVVLGDRFEILGVTIAAHLLRIPVAHISGGEQTQGATDDAMRHAITKMSWLHFAATEAYRNRVIQLGESPERVYNVGAIGLDNIKNLELLDKKAFEAAIDWTLGAKNILITFHPVTLEHQSAEDQFEELLAALHELSDTHLIFTLPNADAGGRAIVTLIHAFVQKHPENARAYTSLGQLKYLSALKFMDMVVGNSSSGVVEVPSFLIPTVNIGNRQKGREMPPSVINVDTNTAAIRAGIQLGYTPTFRESIKNQINPYGSGNTAPQILSILKKTGKIADLKKIFHDLI